MKKAKIRKIFFCVKNLTGKKLANICDWVKSRLARGVDEVSLWGLVGGKPDFG